MTVVEDKHQKLREILIDYGSEEFGDAIVDEICELFGYPKTGCETGWRKAQADYKEEIPYFQISEFKRIYFDTWDEYYEYMCGVEI